MYPVLFKIGPITIYSYGVAIALAYLGATYLAAKKARRVGPQIGIGSQWVYDLSIWILVGGIIGARVLYVLTDLNYYLDNPVEIIYIWQGGLVYYGGLIGGAIAGLVYLFYILHLTPHTVIGVVDLVIPYVALGQSIGRIGCFLNGCCYGKYGHPTQLYESFATLMIFIVLNITQGLRLKAKGYILSLYLLLYSAARFELEYIRGDNIPVLFGLTISQIISIPVFLGSVYASIMLCKQKTCIDYTDF